MMYQAIYVLPIELTVLLVIGVLLFWRDLRLIARRDYSRMWRIFCAAGLLLWMLLVLHMTHLSRSVSDQEPHWIPFYQIYTVLTGGNRELLRSAWMNFLLFIPGGVLAFDVLPGKRGLFAWTASAALFSTAIELAQWLLHHGLAETDDILANTAGAAAGFLLAKLFADSKNL